MSVKAFSLAINPSFDFKTLVLDFLLRKLLLIKAGGRDRQRVLQSKAKILMFFPLDKLEENNLKIDAVSFG